MTKAEQREERKQRKREDRQRIAQKVLRALGRPPTLVSVDVIHIHNHSYRVNVVTSDCAKADTMNILSRRIAHSFFVIEYAPSLELESSPPITKVYVK